MIDNHVLTDTSVGDGGRSVDAAIDGDGSDGSDGSVIPRVRCKRLWKLLLRQGGHEEVNTLLPTERSTTKTLRMTSLRCFREVLMIRP